MVFLSSVVTVTVNQKLLYKGLYLPSLYLLSVNQASYTKTKTSVN
jgi:hypothetical protein